MAAPCPACGHAVRGSAVTCAACGAYLYRAQVEDLMRRALAAEQGNYYREAMLCWQRLLPLLPPGSVHRPRLEKRITQLQRLQPAAAAPPPAEPAAPPPAASVAPPARGTPPLLRRRWLLPACGLALLALLALLGFRYGPKLAARLLLTAPPAAADGRTAVAAALAAEDWVQAQKLLTAARGEPWVAQAQLAFMVCRDPQELRGRLLRESEPEELNRVLVIGTEPVWAALHTAADSIAAATVGSRVRALEEQMARLGAASAAGEEEQVTGLWHAVTGTLKYFRAIDAERCAAAAAAVRQVTVWRDEVAPTAVHLWLAALPGSRPEGGWTDEAAGGALSRIESALSAQPEPSRWLPADRDRALAVLRGLAAGDSTVAVRAGTATYADAVAVPPVVAAGALIDWPATIITCEVAPGGQPFAAVADGGEAVQGDYRLQVAVAGTDSGAVRMAVALCAGNLPAAVTRAAHLRLLATFAGLTPFTDRDGVVRRVPLLEVQRLTLPDGTVFFAGQSGQLTPAVRARQLLLRLTPPSPAA